MYKRLPLALATLLIGFSVGWVLRSPEKPKLRKEIEGIHLQIPAGVPVDGKSHRPLDVYLVEEDGEVIYDRASTDDSPPVWVITVGNRRYYAIPRPGKS